MGKFIIYGVHNVTENKWYIGSTTTGQDRLDTHRDNLKNNNKINDEKIKENSDVKFLVFEETEH